MVGEVEEVDAAVQAATKVLIEPPTFFCITDSVAVAGDRMFMLRLVGADGEWGKGSRL